MKLFLFYLALVGPLLLIVLISKGLPVIWFVVGFFAYLIYNLLLVNLKLRRKGYRVGFLAHLNPFSKKSQELYQKVFFEP